MYQRSSPRGQTTSNGTAIDDRTQKNSNPAKTRATTTNGTASKTCTPNQTFIKPKPQPSKTHVKRASLYKHKASISKRAKVIKLEEEEPEQCVRKVFKLVLRHTDFRGPDRSDNFLTNNALEEKRFQNIFANLVPPIVSTATVSRFNQLLFLQFKERDEMEEFKAAFESINYQEDRNAELINLVAVRGQKPELEVYQTKARERSRNPDRNKSKSALMDFDY
jgi:hypothetical protein